MTQPARRTFLPGHVVVIICSITTFTLNLARTIHLERYTWDRYQYASFTVLGLLFLSYPLLGYIADVCLTRYRTLKCSFAFLIIGCTIGLLTSFVTVIVSCTTQKQTTQKQTQELFQEQLPYKIIIDTVVAIAAFMIITGVGSFEAIMPFNLDWINY